MSIQEKAQGTVAKLLQLTVRGELEWSRFTDTRGLTRGTDEVVPVAYTTVLAGNRFVLYEARFQTMDGDENVYWTDRIVLQLTDDEGAPVWEFPTSPALRTLLNRVSVQAAGVEARLDKILNL